MSRLNEQDNRAIEEAIKKAEANTSGEIVFTAAPSSAHYYHATLQGALLGMVIITAIYLALPYFDHSVVHMLWIQFISFAVFYAVLPYLSWRRWLISKQEMDARVRDAAFMQFYASGLYKTRELNGVEIYLSFFEREVIVLGDRGIHEKMGDHHWQEVRDLIIKGMKDGRVGEGICAAIEKCGSSLAAHFPHRPDDINELPDQIINRPLHPDAP